jgi:hypothetical protein
MARMNSPVSCTIQIDTDNAAGVDLNGGVAAVLEVADSRGRDVAVEGRAADNTKESTITCALEGTDSAAALVGMPSSTH